MSSEAKIAAYMVKGLLSDATQEDRDKVEEYLAIFRSIKLNPENPHQIFAATLYLCDLAEVLEDVEKSDKAGKIRKKFFGKTEEA